MTDHERSLIAAAGITVRRRLNRFSCLIGWDVFHGDTCLTPGSAYLWTEAEAYAVAYDLASDLIASEQVGELA